MADRLYVATRKGLFIWEQDAGRWRISSVSFLGDNVSMVLQDPRDGAVYAALALGHFGVKLHRSDDGGATWEELPAPVYPAGAEQPVRTEPDAEPKTKPASLSEIWALETGGADQPGRLWCGTLPGALFRSDDRGASWSLVESLWNVPERMQWFGGGKDEPGIHSICVDPRDSRHVRVAISCGGVWETHDDGAAWKCEGKGFRADYMPPELANVPHIQDAHRLAHGVADADSLWVQHHNGVFHSTDGGANWSELTNAAPSVFGFAVAAHPHDGKTAWFIPGIKDERRIPVDGKLVVSRTRDGGESFEVLREGLPQEHAYDLVFRHGLDVDFSGDQLAFGSTTGGLWTSADGGDSWSEATHTLPPVYCVRFHR